MNKNVIDEAIFFLKKGELVVYPTDTIYGIGADIYNTLSVEKVFKIKRRPKNLPLSVAVSSIKDLEKIAFLNKKSTFLARRFLPGPLSLILKKKDQVPDIVTSGSKKVAVRIPDNFTALKLLKNFGPITCTSANIHNKPTPNVINKIRMQFKSQIPLYIDKGKLSSLPSTIVDATSDNIEIIREGKFSSKDIMEAIDNG